MGLVAKVYVTPKAAILDPQGKAVATSLRSLGYEEVADVRLGKYIVVELGDSDRERARARVREMCEQLLANQVIEDFEFELEAGCG
jgi:phosphoribosylformylglycinamidine synthase